MKSVPHVFKTGGAKRGQSSSHSESGVTSNDLNISRVAVLSVLRALDVFEVFSPGVG